MNKVANIALAAAVALVLGSSVSGNLLTGVVASAAAEDAAPPKGQVSAAAGKDLQAAQKAFNAKNYDEALADLEKVKANPKKNDYDEYVMNQFYASVYGSQNKLDMAEAAVEALMASKYMPPDELKKRLVQAAVYSYNLKNYDKAIDYGSRALKAGVVGVSPMQIQLVVAQSYFLKSDWKNTDHFVRGMVDDEIKAGQMPTEDVLKMGLEASGKQNDNAGETHWLELLATYHPKPEYWDNLLAPVYGKKPTDRQVLEIYRLSLEVGVLKHGSDYGEMAQLALGAGSPGEAVSVLTKGFAADAFTEAAEKNRNQHLLDSAKKQAAADQPTLAKSEADGMAAATGDRLVGAGIGYFGYGDYARAAKDIAAGLAKGMTKDSLDAHLLLGIAQLKSGDKDSAIKTFKTVKGDPVLERLAALWIIHSKAA